MGGAPLCGRCHCRRAGAADRQNGVKSLFPRRGGNGQMISSVRAGVSPNRPIAYGGSPPENPPGGRVVFLFANGEKALSPPPPPPREGARRPTPPTPKGLADPQPAS